MQISQEQIEKLLNENMPSIIESFKKDIVSSVSYQVKQEASAQITLHVTEWMRVNILPEIEKTLVEGKEGLVSLGVVFGEKAVTAMVDVFVEELKKKLNSSWDRKKIMEAMFG